MNDDSVSNEPNTKVRSLPARQLWLLPGSIGESLDKLQKLASDDNNILFVGNVKPASMRCIKSAQAKTVLGQEHGVVIFDCYSGFDPDALGAVVGTLRAGGALILLTPELSAWPLYEDPNYERIRVHSFQSDDISTRYLSRFIQMLADTKLAQLIQAGEALPQLELAKVSHMEVGGGCISHDQVDAVNAIMHVVQGHRRRPLVITADRGRGKSASLGIAAAKLITQGCKKILLTAPQLSACENVFKHAAEVLSDAKTTHASLHWHESVLQFVAPDELLLTEAKADLLIVDEAAAIPASMLEALLERYSRIVFSSTVHGYEGTGRGFSIRFEKTLNRKTPSWKKLSMQTPVRWSVDDPLEAFIFDALLLNAETVAGEKVKSADPSECVVEKIDRDTLVGHDKDISQLFGLLVLAHYRTRPLDLWQLLDGPNLEVYVTRYRGDIVATALLAYEGGFDSALADEVYHSRRRPRGHLLPQSLATHGGIQHAACLRYGRIMRIAVHPVLQGRGIGQALVRAIKQDVYDAGCDAVGTSYGLSSEVFGFWRQLDFKPVRLGLSREHTSGSHSLLMLSPLSDEGEKVFELASLRFFESFPLLLSERLRDLPVDHVAEILTASEEVVIEPSAQDWRELVYFAQGGGGYDLNIVVLNRWAMFMLRQHSQALEDQQRAIIVIKILQRRPWSDLVAHLKLRGQSEAINLLRQVVLVSVDRFASP